MGKKNIVGMILALVMVATLCLDSYAVYARDLGENQEPAIEKQVVKEEPGKDEKIEKPEKVVEEKGKENPTSSEEADKKLVKEEEKVQKEEAKEVLDLGEEKVPEPVGVPEAFDLSKINTIAKDKDGNYYGVKTYGNSYGDTDIFKTYYKITEDQYNEVAKSCFMVFKRADGQAFKLQGVKISISYIDDENLKDGVTAGPIFTEIQFKHHMAYRLGFLVNNSPLKVDGQEKLTWSITLKKDWVIERCPDFSDNSSPDYAYVNYNVEIDGGGHKICRNDDGVTGILQLGSGLSGQDVPVRTAKIKNLTIEGNNKYYGIELSQKGILYLENVKIENCYAGKNHYYYGGAIKLNNEAQLTMDTDTSISNCKANLGGAIRLLDNCSLTINGSTFTNNQADLGGAICALKDNCKININNATFNGNKAVNTITDEYLQGGAIYTNSPLNISGTTFKDNFANKNGGAIISYADTTISSCNFTENKSTESNGGAIYQGEDKLEVKNSNFTKNESPLSGGAIYALGKTDIKDTKFSENKAKWGGAIANFSELSINTATFEKNEAKSNGGAIYTSKGIKVEDSSLVENKATKGGAVYISKGESEIKNTSFTKNESKNGGGAIFINRDNNGTTSISKTSFTENISNAFGGGIYLGLNGKLEVSESEFTKNQAAYGAGISSAGDGSIDTNLSNIKVEGTSFTENEALEGGGIFTAFPAEVSTSTFTKNIAHAHPKDDQKNPHFSGVGGAIRVMDNKTTIKGSTFEENWAFGSGGAIGINGLIRDDDLKITGIKEKIKVEISNNTKFIRNICNVGQGGAIYTIPYLYDIENQETDVDKATLKANAYKNLTTSADTVFKDNVALSGFANPPANYAKYNNLAFARNSFTDVLPNQIVAKSLLNNYDVNYMNKDLSAFFDPNGGEFTEGQNPKNIRVVKDKKDAEIKLLEAPKREGYKFTGWKCSMNIPEELLKGLPKDVLEKLKEGKIYKPRDKFTLDADYIFIAQWEKVEKPTPKPDNKPTPKPTPRGSLFFVGPTPLLNKEDHAQYLIGYQDRTFGAENKMTREEVAVMFSRLLKNPPRKGQVYPYDFSDVARDRWSITAISYMNQLGIIKGYPDGTFKPEASITRAEFAAMAARFAELKEGRKTFTDLDKDYWAYDLIQRAASAGWITGYPDGTFKPDKNITRAEVVAITNRMLDRKADQDFVDQNLGKLLQFTDLDKSYWAYYPILEATNGHDYIRHENKLDEHWKEVTGKTFVYDK